MNVTVHKKNIQPEEPLVSIILLDWSVRERFQALEWLRTQTIPREKYELIWVELYDRIVPDAIAHADTVITCGQKGLYHKHEGYNSGLLHSRGKIITICDSDAVFPPAFIESILSSFSRDSSGSHRPIVLMHYQYRTPSMYPDDLKDIAQLCDYKWVDLWPNVGACMSVRKEDAMRFGGFDEHKSYRGYMCGPYDLGWRLVNAGLPEIWHDPSIALSHFSHPDPYATYNQRFSFRLWREIAHPHVDGHALFSVEAFSTGKVLPYKENSEIKRARMEGRVIGTEFEKKYSNYKDGKKFSWLDITAIRFFLIFQFMVLYITSRLNVKKPLLIKIKKFAVNVIKRIKRR